MNRIMVLQKVFFQYKQKLIVKLFGNVNKHPWMREVEIEIISKILKKLQPENCLEWGSGYSTLFFPKYLPKNASWLSIEHNLEWSSKIKKMNFRSNVEIVFIKPNFFPWTDNNCDGELSNLKDYIEYADRRKKFDFILIDGRARKDCLINAYDLITDNGVIILHDANRKYYHEPFRFYKDQILLTDYREDEGGLWIGSRNRCIGQILDVDEYMEYYGFLNKNWKTFHL